jgi:hypothetical protein
MEPRLDPSIKSTGILRYMLNESAHGFVVVFLDELAPARGGNGGGVGNGGRS